MSGIGIIVRADKNLEALDSAWVPVPLGPRGEVERVVAELLADAEHLMLMTNIESSRESDDPRAISVSGVWGDQERAVLRQLCSRFGARFYDAEVGEFVAL